MLCSNLLSTWYLGRRLPHTCSRALSRWCQRQIQEPLVWWLWLHSFHRLFVLELKTNRRMLKLVFHYSLIFMTRKYICSTAFACCLKSVGETLTHWMPPPCVIQAAWPSGQSTRPVIRRPPVQVSSWPLAGFVQLVVPSQIHGHACK